MFIQIKRNSSTPMIKQVYNQVKFMILNGDLKANFRLPSSRRLSEDLKISRIVIVEAYEMLTAEGYTRTLKGSGTYVNENIAIMRHEVSGPLVGFTGMEDENIPISFRSGLPALDKFPRNKWLHCNREVIHYLEDKDLGYGMPSGHSSFRKTLSEYLNRSRGIRCHQDQIIVTSGAVQGLFLLAQYFKQYSSKILIEDPINKAIREMLKFNQLSTISHPVDEYGLNPATLPNDVELSCIIATPSHQYPMGGSLPISRRTELIRYARKHKCYIIEDDYDSEYRYNNTLVESMHELDSERVIYLGSFSKVLLPSIRIGYMVLPLNLIEPIYKLKNLIDIHCPTLNQMTMDRFISSGYLEQHLSKMKKLYKKRRTILMNALDIHFGDNVTILGNETGIHLVAEFHGVTFTNELIAQIKRNGVYVMRVSDYTIYPNKHTSQLILGYANLSETNIQNGIKILHRTIREFYNW